MSGFVSRLVQRSRGEAVVAEPYRTPLPASSPALPDTVSDSASRGQNPTADSVFLKPGFQDRPQAPGVNSQPRVKPDPLNRRPETLHPVVSPVIASVIQNDVHITGAKPGINPLPESDANTQSLRPQHANPYAAQPERVTPGRVVFHETHEHAAPPAESRPAEGLDQALPLTRFHDSHLEQTVKPQKRRLQQQRAQQKHRRASAATIDKAAVAAMPGEQTIEVHVHIGRIDIRATTNSRQPAQNIAPKTQAAMSLNDYIQQRTGGRR